MPRTGKPSSAAPKENAGRVGAAKKRASSIDRDEVPPLPADFGRRGIVRRGLIPVSCGPDAPEKFKAAVAKAQRRRRRVMKPRLTLPIRFARDPDGWVVLCPALSLASQGRTMREARSMMVEAIELALETYAVQGKLGAILALRLVEAT